MGGSTGSMRPPEKDKIPLDGVAGISGNGPDVAGIAANSPEGQRIYQWRVETAAHAPFAVPPAFASMESVIRPVLAKGEQLLVVYSSAGQSGLGIPTRLDCVLEGVSSRGWLASVGR